MTITPQENTIQDQIVQEKVDASLTQEKVDVNSGQVAAETKATEKVEDPNWKAFREARKKDRAEKEAAERRLAEKEAEATALKAAMESSFLKSNPPQQQQYGYQNQYEQQEETEDQRIDRKVQEQLAKREDRARQEAAQREAQEYPNRLTQTYPDFNNVVTTENLDYLEFPHPELARPLKRLQDGYDKWSDAYQAIKKYVPNAVTSKREAARADANLAKPRSMSSTGLTQNTENTSSAKLSSDRKAANWSRMQQSLKSVS